MKCSWKDHKDRNRYKNRIKRSGRARLVYVKDINCNIPITWRWARGDAKPWNRVSGVQSKNSFASISRRSKPSTLRTLTHSLRLVSVHDYIVWEQRRCFASTVCVEITRPTDRRLAQLRIFQHVLRTEWRVIFTHNTGRSVSLWIERKLHADVWNERILHADVCISQEPGDVLFPMTTTTLHGLLLVGELSYCSQWKPGQRIYFRNSSGSARTNGTINIHRVVQSALIQKTEEKI